jgi:acetyl-CoA C-acetyltransferase
MGCDPFLLRPLGLEQISAAALQANVYFEKYKVTEKDAARVVVKNRKNGALNKYAQLKKEVTTEEVMNSPYLAMPIKKLDAPAYSDGATAVILATEDFAKDVTKNPVWIEGVGFYQDTYYPGYKDLSKSTSCQLAAKKAYSEAGIKEPLKEIDFAEVSENFSFYELMLYENLFLCKEGEGKKLIQDGVTEIDGNFPVNPSGGTLCANSIMNAGLVRVIEAVRQLTKSADGHQLKKDLKKALVHGTDGLFLQSNIVYVLGI